MYYICTEHAINRKYFACFGALGMWSSIGATPYTRQTNLHFEHLDSERKYGSAETKKKTKKKIQADKFKIYKFS